MPYPGIFRDLRFRFSVTHLTESIWDSQHLQLRAGESEAIHLQLSLQADRRLSLYIDALENNGKRKESQEQRHYSGDRGNNHPAHFGDNCGLVHLYNAYTFPSASHSSL